MEGLVQNSPASHALIYQVLDAVLSSTSVPGRSRGTMFSLVDQMRANNGELRYVRLAERVSVELHKLEWSVQRNDKQEVDAARSMLKSLAAELLNFRIASPYALEGLVEA